MIYALGFICEYFMRMVEIGVLLVLNSMFSDITSKSDVVGELHQEHVQVL